MTWQERLPSFVTSITGTAGSLQCVLKVRLAVAVRPEPARTLSVSV